MSARQWSLPPLDLSQVAYGATTRPRALSHSPMGRDFVDGAIEIRPGRQGDAFGSLTERGHVSRRGGFNSARESSARSEGVRSRLSDYMGVPGGGRDPDGFVRRSRDEDCIKCMLRMPHKKCESHKYIRVGGGYRHSFLYVKMLLDEIEFRHQQELLRMRRLEAIQEGGVRAVKTYIRTKSGRLIERIIFLNEDDYQEFQRQLQKGGDPASILRKYLSKAEAKGLESFEKSEQRAIKTFVRTKSGRLIEKIVYVSKEEFDAIQRGEVNANDILKRHLKLSDGQKLEGWQEAKMRAIKTFVRTKSGRLIEKTIMVSEEDYKKLKEGGKLSDVLKKYMALDEGQTIEGWEKPKPQAMKVVKTYVRTKSGRLIEKTILMTEDEFKEFQKSGGDPNFLKKFIKLNEGETIDRWEKASTVYAASDDEEIAQAKPGTRITDKDGNVYEIVTDPITGKKYKKKIGNVNDPNSVSYKTKDGRVITQKDIEKRKAMKAGKRDPDSESDYSYRSVYSAGGTRHVRRRKKNADGTYGDEESYHSSQDEDGAARRRRRRRDRKHGADSAHSYYSVVSEGGTRHVRRRKRNPDGTYGDDESYHSEDSAVFKAAEKAIKAKQKKLKERVHGSDSEHSYYSEVSAGGTRTRKRRKRIRDEHGNIIGYGKTEEYSSDSDGGNKKAKKGKKGKRDHGSDSDHSYFSEVSAGGTRTRKRRQRIRDKDGNVIGYGKVEDYSSEEDGGGGGGKKKKKKKEREHGADSDHSYFSEVSAGGTRTRKRRMRIRDKDGNIIGYGDPEAYSSPSEDEGAGGKGGKGRKGKKGKGGVGDDSDDDYSYVSERSAGGTRYTKRMKRIRDKDGKVIGYGKAQLYDENELKKGKKGKKQRGGPDSDHSYYSDVTEGGTRVVKRRKRIRDEHGRVIGHGKEEIYESSDSEASFITVSDGKGGKVRIKNPNKKQKKGKGGDSDFSDCTTDSEAVAEKLKNMTEEEKKVYLAEREKRKQEREQKRREKYGDKYEEMMEKHQKKKEEYKSMVTYGKGGSRFKKEDEDGRGIGMAHEEWGKKGKKGKDGHEADSESEFTEDEFGNKVKKKKKRRDSDSSSVEIIRDKHGNIIKKIKKDKDGNVIEYEYDKHGNVISKKVKKKGDDQDDGDYFEIGEDGKIRLKPGKKRIDLSKLSKDDLRKLGIDPNLSKAEIMKKLKEKFGDDLDIHFGGRKVGTKNIADYGSDMNDSDLAADSDLDVDTLKGIQRVRVIMKRGGQALLEHMKRVIEMSNLSDTYQNADERDATIDFLSAYRLVDPLKLEMYAKAFIVEDADDMDGQINYRQTRIALDGIPSILNITEKQMDYVMKVLDIDENTEMTFRMFAVVIALCERVSHMDQFSKDLLEITNLIDIERKLALYRAMFYCNVSSDRDANFIKAESLRIELMAGGLNWPQQDFVMNKLEPNDFLEISFLDYLVYIPLFLSFHDNICDNPLDMSNCKYTPSYRRKASAQRDMNPLGSHLTKESPFFRKKQAQDLLEGKEEPKAKSENKELLNRYSKLPNIIGASYPATPQHGRSRGRFESSS